MGKSLLQLHIVPHGQSFISREMQQWPVQEAARGQSQPLTASSETSIKSPSSLKTSGRFKRGLGETVTVAKGGRLKTYYGQEVLHSKGKHSEGLKQ